MINIFKIDDKGLIHDQCRSLLVTALLSNRLHKGDNNCHLSNIIQNELTPCVCVGLVTAVDFECKWAGLKAAQLVSKR